MRERDGDPKRSTTIAAGLPYGGDAVSAGLQTGSMLKHALLALRPRQWIKNLFVFAPLLFARHLFDGALILRSLAAFVLFTAIAGAVYIFNDLFDIHKDREHPFKRLRPIASGALPLSTARGLGLALALVGLSAAFALGWQFALVALGYFLLNLAYTLTLKHFAFADVLCIAGGFVLRVIGGSLAIEVVISKWLLICTFLLALFLALGKRKHEFIALHQNGNGNARKVMEQYRLSHLNWALWSVGFLTLLSYVLYTVAAETVRKLGTPYLPVTIVFIAFGILRFVKLLDLHDAESPTEEMLKDIPFIANAVLWVTAVTVILYQGG
jgi:4-hydroxybenzoate polyprenyltransferase